MFTMFQEAASGMDPNSLALLGAGMVLGSLLLEPELASARSA